MPPGRPSSDVVVGEIDRILESDDPRRVLIYLDLPEWQNVDLRDFQRHLLSRAAYMGARRTALALIDRCFFVFSKRKAFSFSRDLETGRVVSHHNTPPHTPFASIHRIGSVLLGSMENQDESDDESDSLPPPRQLCPIAHAILGGHEVRVRDAPILP